jgi:hypothetical protein
MMCTEVTFANGLVFYHLGPLSVQDALELEAFATLTENEIIAVVELPVDNRYLQAA